MDIEYKIPKPKKLRSVLNKEKNYLKMYYSFVIPRNKICLKEVLYVCVDLMVRLGNYKKIILCYIV